MRSLKDLRNTDDIHAPIEERRKMAQKEVSAYRFPLITDEDKLIQLEAFLNIVLHAIDNQEDSGAISMVLEDAIDKLNELHARAPLLSLLTAEQVS